MDAARRAARSVPGTVASRLFVGLQHLARVRASLPHLHASVAAEALQASDPGVLPVLRQHPVGDLLELFNVTETWRAFPWSRIAEFGWRSVRDVVSDTDVSPHGDGNIWLPPYASCWLIGR